jgi:hypothetical protein
MLQANSSPGREAASPPPVRRRYSKKANTLGALQLNAVSCSSQARSCSYRRGLSRRVWVEGLSGSRCSTLFTDGFTKFADFSGSILPFMDPAYHRCDQQPTQDCADDCKNAPVSAFCDSLHRGKWREAAARRGETAVTHRDKLKKSSEGPYKTGCDLKAKVWQVLDREQVMRYFCLWLLVLCSSIPLPRWQQSLFWRDVFELRACIWRDLEFGRTPPRMPISRG